MSHRNTIRRLEKLRATFEALELANKNMSKKLQRGAKPLVQKVKRLEATIEGLKSTAIARENVLKSVSLELDALKAKYEPETLVDEFIDENGKPWVESNTISQYLKTNNTLRGINDSKN